MISYRELIKGYLISDIPIAHQHSLEDLLIKINQIRVSWNKPMIVTSGYRSMQDHIRIYSQIASQRGIDFDPCKVPKGSQHLSGNAVDISDPEGSLHRWCKSNEALLVQVGLWCEEKDDQKRVHFQGSPPKSGKRFFYP